MLWLVVNVVFHVFAGRCWPLMLACSTKTVRVDLRATASRASTGSSDDVARYLQEHPFTPAYHSTHQHHGSPQLDV
jgi:hypothetical protein